MEMMKHFDNWVTDRNINLKRVEEFTSDIENVGRMIDNKYLIFKTSGSTGNPATLLYDKRNIDVSGLNDTEIELISQLVDIIRSKEK